MRQAGCLLSSLPLETTAWWVPAPAGIKNPPLDAQSVGMSRNHVEGFELAPYMHPRRTGMG